MGYALALLLGFLGGGVAVFAALEARRRRVREQERQQSAREKQIQERRASLDAQQQQIFQEKEKLQAERMRFDTQTITYKNLHDENLMLKHDLQNIDVNLWKLQLDRDVQRNTQEALDEKTRELGSRYLKENVKWLGKSLTPNNFVRCKQQLQRAIEWCRRIEFDIPPEEEAALLQDLREEYEKRVRDAFEREEQARIKAQIREEQKLEQAIEHELRQLERERAAIQAALEKALAEVDDEHSEEVERLKARLAEAEEAKQRTISRAQMTKSGHVYVISNIGSFGDSMLKIGMTRRLDPMDRVKELGDASVPFPFDVHMMISSDDAPALENSLHRALHEVRINKVNLRREFFRTDLDTVYQIVKDNHGECQYIVDAEALQYRQSVEMSDEDQDFIEDAYRRAVDGADDSVVNDA